MSKVYASFNDDCWDLDAYKYVIKKDFLLSKSIFTAFVTLMGLIFTIVYLVKKDFTVSITSFGLTLLYDLYFLYSYKNSAKKFINELKQNILSLEVYFYEDKLIVDQKSKSSHYKSTFRYDEILNITEKDDYFFIRFKEIVLPFNQKSLLYYDSNYNDLSNLMKSKIVIRRNKKDSK